METDHSAIVHLEARTRGTVIPLKIKRLSEENLMSRECSRATRAKEAGGLSESWLESGNAS